MQEIRFLGSRMGLLDHLDWSLEHITQYSIFDWFVLCNWYAITLFGELFWGKLVDSTSFVHMLTFCVRIDLGGRSCDGECLSQWMAGHQCPSTHCFSVHFDCSHHMLSPGTSGFVDLRDTYIWVVGSHQCSFICYLNTWFDPLSDWSWLQDQFNSNWRNLPSDLDSIWINHL